MIEHMDRKHELVTAKCITKGTRCVLQSKE